MNKVLSVPIRSEFLSSGGRRAVEERECAVVSRSPSFLRRRVGREPAALVLFSAPVGREDEQGSRTGSGQTGSTASAA